MDEQMARMEKLHTLQQGGLNVRQEELASAVMELDNMLDRLSSLLQPVLREPQPSQALHAQRSPANSPLAAFLGETTDRVRSLVIRLGELGDRVDL